MFWRWKKDLYGLRIFSKWSNIYIITFINLLKTLGELLEKRGQLEELEARYYIKQIIEAINYCHKYKVVHRDLKPDNLIISEAMEVKLIDFGLSNRINKPSRVWLFYIDYIFEFIYTFCVFIFLFLIFKK